MAELTIKQKKEWAASLYLRDNLTQQEIADKTGVSRVTIGKWIKAEKWEEQKAAITTSREEQISNLYRQVSNINEAIKKRPADERFATPREADILSKLAGTIKKMETDIGITDIISVGTRFCNWLRPVDLKKAQEYIKLFDVFLKDSIR